MRANEKPFMTRVLRKAVMLRSRLRNRYNKNQTVENWNKFRKQRNFCVKLFRREKRSYYNNLDISLVTDNKKFWKTVKPFFSDKLQSKSKIVLIEDETIISNDVEVAESMNEFFITATDSLGINENSNYENTTEGIIHPVDKAIYTQIFKSPQHSEN